jgi:hypothetical protein
MEHRRLRVDPRTRSLASAQLCRNGWLLILSRRREVLPASSYGGAEQ